MNSGDGFEDYNQSFEPVTQKDSIQQGNTPIVHPAVSKTIVNQSHTSVLNPVDSRTSGLSLVFSFPILLFR